MASGDSAAKINTLLFFLVGLLCGAIAGYILGGAGQRGLPPASGTQSVSLQLNDVLPVEDVWIVEGFSCPMPGCTNTLLTCQGELSRRIRDWVNSQRAAGRPGEQIRQEIIREHGSNLYKLQGGQPADSTGPGAQ